MLEILMLDMNGNALQVKVDRLLSSQPHLLFNNAGHFGTKCDL